MSTVSVSDASRNLSHWVNSASYGRDCIVITSHGRPKAVLIGISAFEELLGLLDENADDLLPVTELRTNFRAALGNAGYTTHDDLIKLVREVKEELTEQRSSSDY